MIPITKPLTSEEEVQMAAEVIRSGWLTQGPKTAAFEEALAKHLGAKNVVAVSSCTTALHLAVLLADLKPGDEVIVPSYTFVATANALLYAGVRPVFADIDSQTFNLNPDLLSERITPKTKAVLVVDQFGLAADLEAFETFCQSRNLKLIEDAACALGGTYRRRKIGSKGRFVTFSFHPRKSITTCEGGALVTDDPEVAKRARVLRSHGASVSDLDRHKNKGVTFESYTELGYNYRLSDVHAAIGLAQLARLTDIRSKRRDLARRYSDKLSKIGWITPPFEPEWAEHPYQTYASLIHDNAPRNRDALIQHLAESGISSRRGIPPIHREPYISKFVKDLPDLPVTDRISRQTLILPLYPQMTFDEQDQVINRLQEAGR